MTTYVPLGARPANQSQGQVTADQTGNNPGNWTVQYNPNDLNVPGVPYFEVCHIVVNGAPGSSFTLWIENYQWDAQQNGFQNSWDPSVPLPLRPGQRLFFYYSDPVTDGLPPSVTIWLRYDADIPANKAALLGFTSGGG
jgi:hypothetical protein